VIDAHKDGRLLSGATRRIRAATIDPYSSSNIDREPIQRFRLALPKVSGRDFPAIVTSGDFSNCEGRALKVALKAAIDGRSKLPAAIRAIWGLSGQKYRILINTLIETLDRPRYLEIGSWLGSAAAAIYGNNVQAVRIDNWSEFSGY
jgi:hypothetical protein